MENDARITVRAAVGVAENHSMWDPLTPGASEKHPAMLQVLTEQHD